MKVAISLDKSVEENASEYYDKAKKAKRKLVGAKLAVEKAIIELEKLNKKKEEEDSKLEVVEVKRNKHWYEKFRWFFTSEGFLVVGGRDATSNEVVIKKHAEAGDLVFHTDMAGSPFFVIKAEGKVVGQTSIKETADATASYSRAWKAGLTSSSVFYVKPEQVSKEAQAGEYLAKGAFMIRGETKYVDNSVGIAVGITKEGAIMGGPLPSVKKACAKYVEVSQGDEKPSSAAKLIKKKLEGGDLDEIIRALPAGGCSVK